MAGGNRLTLTKCRRSDQFLFDYYGSLIRGGARFHLPLAEVIEEARELFHFDGYARHNLCISHVKRRKLNRDINQALRPEGAVLIRARAEKGQTTTAQNMFIWEGIELLGATAAVKRGIRNNVMYKVSKLDGDDVWVRHEEDNPIKLTYSQVASLLRLSYARTYASVQGTEFEDTLRLHDTGSRHFTMRHLFVAMSRAKDTKKIDIARGEVLQHARWVSHSPEVKRVLFCTKHMEGPLDVWYDCSICEQGTKEEALRHVRWLSPEEVACLNKNVDGH